MPLNCFDKLLFFLAGDFKAWPIDRVKPICNNLGYRPNSAPFQGNTGYQSDFQRHPLSVRQSMRPQEQTNKSDQPFNEETSYKKEYTLKCVTPPKRPPKAAFTASQAPFDSQTRYKIDFTEKQFPKVASCKPDGGAYVSNAPFQGQSTQKEDYIKKTIPERFIHTQDVYKKPDGEMEKNTTTHRDFDRKPMEPTPKARPAEKRGMPGKFRDETTNKVDYPWQAYQAQRVIKKSEYHPPEAPLEGVPTYQRDYTKHQINLVKSMKPLESAKISDEPFAQSTGYREEYTKKHMEPIARREQPVWNKNPAKFEGSTNYNQDYIEKTPEKRLNFKPDQTPYTTNDPFIASTTNRSDFTAMPLQKPYVHEGATYVPSTGQMEDQTTSKIDYCQKPIERSLPRRPPSSNRSPGKFYSDTTNKLDFGHKEPIFVQRVGPRQEYVKPDAPFAGLSNYTSDYQNKGYALRQSMRPNEAPISSGARFDDTTMYRTEFQKRLTKCPVMLLQSVTEASPTNYNFLGQDPTGHKFYEKTATPPIAV